MADTETKPDPSKTAEAAFYAIDVMADNEQDAAARWAQFDQAIAALKASWTEPE